MVSLLLQKARTTARSGQSLSSMFRRLGALGLFSLAILDSSPLPTFGGPDILTAILSASHHDPWYEYALVATAGSVIGAYLTFRLSRQAGSAYLDHKFKKGRVAAILRLFKKSSDGILFASCAIPFPFPTSMLFAAAGVSNYKLGKFLAIVVLGRGIRYALIALVADHYGRHFIRALRHPSQFWGWWLLLVALGFAMILAGILFNRRLSAAAAD